MLISERQHQANMQNAQKSPGPTSEEGKERSSRNAITWGLRTRFTICPELGEDPFEYYCLWEDFESDWSPVGRTEHCYVEAMVHAQWMLARLARVERVAFLRHMNTGEDRNIDMVQRVDKSSAHHQRTFDRALESLRKIQAERRAREREFQSESESEQPKPVAVAPSSTPNVPPPAYVMSPQSEPAPMTCAPADTR